MGQIVLYFAISADRYLANERNGVGWLCGDGIEPDAPGSYPAFLNTVDAIVMGWTTYHQLVTELFPDVWPYEGLPCYVATHRQEEDQKGIFFLGGDLAALVDSLKAEYTGSIWICGGTSVAGQLLKAGRIDKLWLSIIPTVLGRGVCLFSGLPKELPLKLAGAEHWNGIVDMVYLQREL